MMWYDWVLCGQTLWPKTLTIAINILEKTHFVKGRIERDKPMAMCEVCGKKPSYGHNVSHAKNHTPRRWMPNIQTTRVMIGGEYQRV